MTGIHCTSWWIGTETPLKCTAQHFELFQTIPDVRPKMRNRLVQKLKRQNRKNSWLNEPCAASCHHIDITDYIFFFCCFVLLLLSVVRLYYSDFFFEQWILLYGFFFFVLYSIKCFLSPFMWLALKTRNDNGSGSGRVSLCPNSPHHLPRKPELIPFNKWIFFITQTHLVGSLRAPPSHVTSIPNLWPNPKKKKILPEC